MPRSHRPGHASRRTSAEPGGCRSAGAPRPWPIRRPQMPRGPASCSERQGWNGRPACVRAAGREASFGRPAWEAHEHLPLGVWEQTLSPGAWVILRRALGPSHRLLQQSKEGPHPPRSGAGAAVPSPVSRGEGKAVAASMALPRGLGSTSSSLRNPSTSWPAWRSAAFKIQPMTPSPGSLPGLLLHPVPRPPPPPAVKEALPIASPVPSPLPDTEWLVKQDKQDRKKDEAFPVWSH